MHKHIQMQIFFNTNAERKRLESFFIRLYLLRTIVTLTDVACLFRTKMSYLSARTVQRTYLSKYQNKSHCKMQHSVIRPQFVQMVMSRVAPYCIPLRIRKESAFKFRQERERCCIDYRSFIDSIFLVKKSIIAHRCLFVT